MISILAVAVGRIVRFIIRIFRRGGGSAFPGTVASSIAPNLLSDAIRSARKGLVVVSGSSGKSSTTQVLVALLRAHGYKVFTNPSTANIKHKKTKVIMYPRIIVRRLFNIPARVGTIK